MFKTKVEKFFLVTLLFCMPVMASEPDKARINETLETLRLAVNAHDYSQLEPLLDDDFTYQGKNSAMSTMIMRHVVNGYPQTVSAIRVLSISPVDRGWDVTLKLVGEGPSKTRQVTIGKNYRIMQADIADIQMRGHGHVAGPPPGSGVPAMITLPFELQDRLIVVQAELNGVFGNYIVDSGAQTMMLNSTRFSEDAISLDELNHAAPSGAGGAIANVKGTRGLKLSWGALELGGLDGLVTDLTHLEENLGGIELAGLIGFNVLEKFQVHFDYAALELTLISLDEKNQPVTESVLGRPGQIIDFDMMAHIPVLPVQIAGLNLNMGLDSGAAGAMIFTKWREALDGQYEFIKRDELTGADQNVQMGDVVRIQNMQFGRMEYTDMTFRFNDLAGHGGQPVPFDGLLGYEFLKTRPTAINFRTGQLMLWN
jgi:hypothetical protein